MENLEQIVEQLRSKICPDCKKSFPLETGFYADRWQSNKKRPYCKTCDNRKRKEGKRTSKQSSKRPKRQLIWFKTREAESNFFRLCEHTQAMPEQMLDMLLRFAVGQPGQRNRDFLEFTTKEEYVRNLLFNQWPWLNIFICRELKAELETWAQRNEMSPSKCLDLLLRGFFELDKFSGNEKDLAEFSRSFADRNLQEMPL